MNKELLIQALTKALSGLVMICLLLFVPAGTLHYPQAWLFLAVLFIPMIIMGVILLKKDPELLRKRLNDKEEEDTQKAVVVASGLLFLSAFLIAGLNYRFKWHVLPMSVSYIASVIFLIGYGLYGECMRENAYLSRTVEVQEDQKVIDTGLYGIVRHPMYLSTVLMFSAMPLILGSFISFVIMLSGYLQVIAVRMKNEEELLEEGLQGYKEYKEKVRYKIIPYIW